MTLEDFLARLSKTPRRWKIEHETIRLQDADGHLSQCPITSLLDRFAWDWKEVASEVGLSLELARQITDAADCNAAEFQPTRKLLLEACGLTEGQGIPC